MRRLMGAVLVAVLVVACTGEEAAEEEVVIPTPTAPIIADRQSDEDDAVEEDAGDEAGEDHDAEGSAAQDEDPADDEDDEGGGDGGEDGDEAAVSPDALREPGQPGEVFLPAARQDEVNPALDHAYWYEVFKPAPVTHPEWEWANKEELWDEIVERVWTDAVERYGDRLYDRPGTVWPGADRSAYAVWAWGSHDETGGNGQITLGRVGLQPRHADQQRPDVAVYRVQIHVAATDNPSKWMGTVHRVMDPFEMSGELTYPEETRHVIHNSPTPEGGWEKINPEFEAGLD